MYIENNLIFMSEVPKKICVVYIYIYIPYYIISFPCIIYVKIMTYNKKDN